MKGLKMLFLAGGSIALGILLANSNFYGRTYAQNGPSAELKIGVVNLQNCFDKYDGAQDYKEDIKSSFERSKSEINELQQRIKDLKDQIQGAPEGKLKDSKFREYLELGNKLEVTTKWNEAQLVSLREGYMAKMYNEARESAAKVAQEQGLTAIFKMEGPLGMEESKADVAQNISYRTVLYASKAIDITDMVLSRMNADYKKRK